MLQPRVVGSKADHDAIMKVLCMSIMFAGQTLAVLLQFWKGDSNIRHQCKEYSRTSQGAHKIVFMLSSPNRLHVTAANSFSLFSHMALISLMKSSVSFCTCRVVVMRQFTIHGRASAHIICVDLCQGIQQAFLDTKALRKGLAAGYGPCVYLPSSLQCVLSLHWSAF